MRIDRDLALVFRILLHLAQVKQEGATAHDMADSLGVGIYRVTGKCRMLEQDGVLAVNREELACRHRLALPPAKVDLRTVAGSIDGGVRPSAEDWRATSYDPDLEGAIIGLEKGKFRDGQPRTCGTLAGLMKVLKAGGGKR